MVDFIINPINLKLTEPLDDAQPIGILNYQSKIKVNLRQMVDSLSETKACEQDLCLLKRINHENILKYYGLYVDDDGFQFLIFESINSKTLYEYIREDLSPIEKRIQIAMQIVNVMCYLHYNGMLHLNLTSSSILVDKTGTQVKLLDLGASTLTLNKINTRINNNPEITYASWLSPEFLNECYQTEKSDSWSFGCILHELAYSETIFGEKCNPVNIIKLLKCDKQEIPLSFKSDQRVLKEINDIIRQCLMKNPKKRPTFKEIQKDLEEFWLKQGETCNNTIKNNSIASSIPNQPNAQSTLFSYKQNNHSFNHANELSDTNRYDELNYSIADLDVKNFTINIFTTIKQSIPKSNSSDEASNATDSFLIEIDKPEGSILVGKLNEKNVYRGPRGGLFTLKNGKKNYLNKGQQAKLKKDQKDI